jgi:hypothetical protein
MKLITGLDQTARQLIRIQTEDNYDFQFLLQYSVNRQGWFWSLAYNDFAVNGCRLNLNPNILHRYSYKLPFGLMCLTDEPQVINPYRLDDFESGRIKLYSLTKDETIAINLATNG